MGLVQKNVLTFRQKEQKTVKLKLITFLKNNSCQSNEPSKISRRITITKVSIERNCP